MGVMVNLICSFSLSLTLFVRDLPLDLFELLLNPFFIVEFSFYNKR